MTVGDFPKPSLKDRIWTWLILAAVFAGLAALMAGIWWISRPLTERWTTWRNSHTTEILWVALPIFAFALLGYLHDINAKLKAIAENTAALRFRDDPSDSDWLS